MGNAYKLKNGFWINVREGIFDLFLDDDLIINDCHNFSFIYDKLIVIKKGQTITIFSIKPEEKNGKKIPNKLTTFSNTSPNIFADIVIGEYCYTIDYNCQITISPSKRRFNPKIN